MRPVDDPADAIAAVTHPDPYPYYAGLVARRPLHRDDSLGLWVAASAAAVTEVLTSAHCRVRPAAEPVPKHLVGTPVGDLFGRLVRMNDGAYHARARPAVSVTVAMLDPVTAADEAREAAQTLVAELEPAPHSGRITELASRLPAYVIAGLLGLPRAVHREIAAGAGDLVRALAPGAGAADVVRGGVAVAVLTEAVRSLPRYRGAGEDAIANVVGFFSQSYEATAGLTGNTLVALARHAGLRERLAAEPTTLSSIVSEVARHDAPVQNTRRWVADAGVVAGRPMAAGDAILVLLAAANRDPAVNTDPDCFEAGRQDRRAFTFGLGAHACPGEALAVAIASAGVAAMLAAGVAPERVAAAPAYRPSVNTRVPLFA
jgi:cytochrome P450